MGVAGDDHVESSCCWVQVERVGVMQHIDAPIVDLHDQIHRQGVRPASKVHVASHRCYGCGCPELIQDLLSTDITSVDDPLAALEDRYYAWTNETMGV